MKDNILTTGCIYHIYSKSIAGFKIFNHECEFVRMKKMIGYYQISSKKVRFSKYISKEKLVEPKKENINSDMLIDIVAYCIMPTHLHFVLRQRKEKGVAVFMSNILNSYTRYFNIKYKRKGPLWESRYKKVLVTTDEQLLNLTKYIHLNPVTAYLVDLPEKWDYSSYKQYLSTLSSGQLCDYGGLIHIDPKGYKRFVEDNINYQRNLAKMKDLIIDQDLTS